MPDLKPLTILLGQHERQRDTALAEHLRARSASDAAAAQAEQLRTYRRDYEQRWREQFSREGKIELVRCYHSFMERLTQAVDQQENIAQHALAQIELAVVQLREAEMRCASVRKLIERRTRERLARSERHEQKHNDELAARVASNHPHAAGRHRLA